MSHPAPPGRPGALVGPVGSLASAAVGGLVAFLSLLACGQALGLVLVLLTSGIGIGSGARIGTIASLAAVRAEIVSAFEPSAGLAPSLPAGRIESHLVPMVLTIAFVLLAAGAGRYAARAWSGGPALARAAAAAAGAGFPVALAAATAASLVSLPVPDLGLTIRVDATSAAAWAGGLAATAAAIGAYLESAAGRDPAAVIRGAAIGYVWALGLLVAAVLLIATLEPTATRGYVAGIRDLGSTGAALFGVHLLALPTQSAMLLAPAAGSCLDVLASGEVAARLCPWEVDAIGPVAEAALRADPIRLSPAFWILVAIPPAAAFLGGRRAGLGAGRLPRIARGALAGLGFAGLSLLGTAFAAPRIVAPVLVTWLRLEVRPWSLGAAGLLGLWGVVGGTLGAGLAGRAYEEPVLPRPTSA